ncbi:LURP-one-related family protein [Clostridiaceae bacterium 35-E11]
MIYKIKQKVFSLGAKFNIKDEADRDVFIVQGEVFSLGKKLRLMDLEENELVYIEQEFFRFLPLYNIYRHGQIVATVKKKLTLFRTEFMIESSQKNYTMEGNIMAHEYTIFSDDGLVAKISKEWFTFGDTYGVEINDDEDQALILALVIVLDQVCHEG